MFHVMLCAAASAAIAAPTAARWAMRDSLRLSLREAVAAGRAGSFSAQGAAAREREAVLRVRENAAALLPQLSVAASSVTRTFNRQSIGIQIPGTPGSGPPPAIIGPYTNQDLRPKASLTLLDLGARGRVSAARAGVGAATGDADATRTGAALAAGTAYVTLMRAEAGLRSRDDQVALADSLLEAAQVQHSAGTVARLDVTRAEVQLAVARAQRLQALGALDQARTNMLRAIGASLSQSVRATDSLALDPLPGPLAVDSLVHLALNARPEVVAERARLEQARTLERSIRSEGLPTLGVAGDYGLNGRTLADSAFRTWTVAVAVQWNAWDGGRRQARLGEQAQERIQAELRVKDVEAQVETDTRNAVSSFLTARDLVGAAREQLRLSQQGLEDALERYRHGLGSNLDVIAAQSDLVRSRDGVLDALAGCATARLILLRAINRLEDL